MLLNSSLLGPGERRRDDLLAAAQDLLTGESFAALTVPRVTQRAAIETAGFYACYVGIDELLDDLASLFIAAHGVTIGGIRAREADPAMRFAHIARQTLRMLADYPSFGRLVYDVGLPIDRFVTGLRASLLADIVEGAHSEAFVVDDSEIITSMVVGGMVGAALDIHRGRLRLAAIEPVTARLLEMLGLSRRDARSLAFADGDFVPPPASPLRWTTLRGPAAVAG